MQEALRFTNETIRCFVCIHQTDRYPATKVALKWFASNPTVTTALSRTIIGRLIIDGFSLITRIAASMFVI